MTEAPAPADTPAAPAPAEGAAPLPSPGALLRLARERAGLGAEDLAGQLKLAKSTLEALERDDFAALSEPVYVRGYYRKIAKVLAVSEQELISAYNARSQPAPSTPAMRRIPLAGGVAAGASRQSRGPGVWVIVGLVGLVILLFTLADRDPPQRLVDTHSSALPAPAPAQTAPEAVDTPTPAPTPDATPSATVAAPPPGQAPAVPAAAPNQLVLEFSAASFVRVEDSRARTLAIGLVRGGERQMLDGQPPYTVFLGNAQNVKVTFGGAAVDFSAHINRQNDTARFTVP